MRVELQDAFSNPAVESSDTVVTLASTSSSGTFSAASAHGSGTLTTITMGAGVSDVYFFYVDTTVGVATLTASGPAESGVIPPASPTPWARQPPPPSSSLRPPSISLPVRPASRTRSPWSTRLATSWRTAHP